MIIGVAIAANPDNFSVTVSKYHYCYSAQNHCAESVKRYGKVFRVTVNFHNFRLSQDFYSAYAAHYR